MGHRTGCLCNKRLTSGNWRSATPTIPSRRCNSSNTGQLSDFVLPQLLNAAHDSYAKKITSPRTQHSCRALDLALLDTA
jgi:hypothetical protein